MADASEKKDKKPSSNPESETLGGSSSSVSLSPITTGPQPRSISSLILLDLPECDEDDVRRSLEERAGPTGHVSRVTLTCNHPNPMTEESQRKYATATVTHTGAVDDVEIAVGLRKPTLCMFSEDCQAVFNINQSLFTESVYNTVAQQAAKLRLAITFYAPARLEVAGSCNDVNKFRGYLSRLCVHNVLHMPELANGIITPVAQPHPEDETAVADSSSSSNVMFSNLSSDVLLLLPKLRTIPSGVRYYPDQGSVEFVSDNPEKREQMISSFQDAYQRIVQNSQFKSGTLELPPSTQAESVITLLNQYNEKYQQCHFSYDPTSHSLKIVTLSSRQFDQAKKLMKKELSGDQPSSSTPHHHGYDIHTLALSDDRSLTIKKGDMIAERADVIVNAANKHLKHWGGLAGALDVASEGALQRHCDIITAKHGDIHTGDAVTTAAGGKLKCKWVVHAVGPVASECDDNDTRYALIHSAVTNALKLAQSVNAKSIVLPALSTGVFAVDPSISAQAIFEAIVSFKYKPDCLNDIRIVIVDQPTYGCFIEQFQFLKVSSIPNEPHKLKRSLSDQSGTATPDTSPSVSSDIRSVTYPSLPTQPVPDSHTPSVPVIHSTITTTTPNSPSSHSNTLLKPATFAPGKPILPNTTPPFSATASVKSPPPGLESTSDECPICLSKVTNPKRVKCCKQVFCTGCIDRALEHSSLCPTCKQPLKPLKGNQPKGTMKHEVLHFPLPGFSNCNTIQITYHFSGGTQGPNHPSPGQRYSGTRRTAYLPDNSEGRHVLKLLEKAFNAGLVFTIGRSVTSGHDNTVTWNDIHHKTNTNQGSTAFGYPDETYLKRVKDELKAKGIH